MKKVREKKYYILSFVVPMLICLIFLSLKGVIPNVESFLVSDLRGQHLPMLNYLKNVLLGKDSLYYSYYAGMGSSMISNLIFYAVSPLNILLVIVRDIRYAILFIYVLKVCLSGLTMFIFLKNKFKKESFVTVVFSTCYAVSAYVVNYFFCMFWFDSVYLAPLVLLGIDKMLDKEKINLVYIFSLSLAIICNIQMGFGLCVFSVVYYLYSFNIKYDIKKDLKKFIKISRIFVISSLCAGGISSGFILGLLSDYKTIVMARNIGDKSYSSTSSIDYIIRDIFSVGRIQVDYNNNFEPFIYCGLVITLLSILYLFDKNVDKKRRKSALLVILFFFVSFCFRGLNVFWHLVDPIQLNYRYSIYLCLFLIMIVYDYYLSKNKFTKRDIMVLSISILIGLLVDFIYQDKIYLFYTVVFLVLDVLLIILVKNKSKKLEMALLLVVLVELVCNAYLSFYINDNLKDDGYTSYDSIKRLGNLNDFEDDYRVYYDYYYVEFNAPFLLRKNSSLSYFFSVMNGNVSRFLNRNYSTSGKNYYLVSSYDSPLLLSLLGNKYFYQVDDIDSGLYKKLNTYKIKNNSNDKKIKGNKMYLYENPYSLSLGYVINKDVKYNKKDTLVDYQNKIIKNFTGNDKDVIKKLEFGEKKNDSYCNGVSEYVCRKYYVKNDTDNEYVYLYATPYTIDTDYDLDIYSPFEQPYLIKSDKDYFEVALNFLKYQEKEKIMVTTYDKDNLISSLKMLQENMLTDVKMDKNVMRAKIETSKDGILFLSIPYDKRFKVYVDGKKVNYYPLLDSAFMGLDIKKGKHKIKLVNKDGNLKWYILSSVIFLIVTLVLYGYQNKERKMFRIYGDSMDKLKHKFHKIGFYLYSVKYYYEDNRSGNVIKRFFKAVIYCSKIFRRKELFYEYLEIPITTACTLKCKKCSNLIPCYKKRKDYDLKILIKSIRMFLECINNIVYIRLLGGEPFLSDNLCTIIKELLKSKKVQRIEVVTNGTVVPTNNRLIALLKNSRVIVSISKYPHVNIDYLVKTLKDNGIKYKIIKRSYWYDYGDTKKRNRSVEELVKQFRNCGNICRSMINGQIHFCPRSSHGTDLGIIKNNRNDYIDILDDSMSLEKKRKLISSFFDKKYIKACDYCDFGTSKCKKIPVAEQMEK